MAFGVGDLVSRFTFLKSAVATAATLTLVGCLALTENQLRYWRDSETLFVHALAVTTDNYTAHVVLGGTLAQKGRMGEAIIQYREAARIMPGDFKAHFNIGVLFYKTGKWEEALPELIKTIWLNPKDPIAHNILGNVLVKLDHFDEALVQFQEAGRLDPAYPWAPFEIGKLQLQQGRDAEAINEFRAALRIDPDNSQILACTARVLAAEENPEVRDGKTAIELATKANILTGGVQPYVLDALGMACAETGDFTNALEVAQKAIDLATAAKMENLEPMEQRLELYRNHQPWRESFLSTNLPPKESPKK